jgi:hypothetical protein
MRNKFAIYKDGVRYKCPDKSMIVMNSEGVFYLCTMEEYYPSIKRLYDVLGSYAVQWGDGWGDDCLVNGEEI